MTIKRKNLAYNVTKYGHKSHSSNLENPRARRLHTLLRNTIAVLRMNYPGDTAIMDFVGSKIRLCVTMNGRPQLQVEIDGQWIAKTQNTLHAYIVEHDTGERVTDWDLLQICLYATGRKPDHFNVENPPSLRLHGAALKARLHKIRWAQEMPYGKPEN